MVSAARWPIEFIAHCIPDDLWCNFGHCWDTFCDDCSGWRAQFIPLAIDAHCCGEDCPHIHFIGGITVLNLNFQVGAMWLRTLKVKDPPPAI